MYYSYIEIEYVATSFSPARTDLAFKLLRKQQSCQKCEHRQSHFDFPNTDSKKISTWVSLLSRNNLLVKLCFFVKSKHWVLAKI
jgi:hypothetical protein